MSDEPLTEDTMIAALLREREGLVQRGLDERVAQVDEQLKLRGYKPPARGKSGQHKPASVPGEQGSGDGKPQGRQQPQAAQT
ncbi:hypothetical protein ACFY7C_37355 [Streptomyces sp. NPDC012769]|uniref:hypothetical protein n=1 Tax=Streptomyces sp. NPDC012769 TaxID=3364848 RepID=UPI0036896883